MEKETVFTASTVWVSAKLRVALWNAKFATLRFTNDKDGRIKVRDGKTYQSMGAMRRALKSRPSTAKMIVLVGVRADEIRFTEVR